MAYLVRMGTDADDIPQFCAGCNCCYGGTGEGSKCYCSADGVRFLIDTDGHEIDPAKEKPSWCKIQGKAETMYMKICPDDMWPYRHDHYECDNCHNKFSEMHKYCPECGAKVIIKEE